MVVEKARLRLGQNLVYGWTLYDSLKGFYKLKKGLLHAEPKAENHCLIQAHGQTLFFKSEIQTVCVSFFLTFFISTLEIIF